MSKKRDNFIQLLYIIYGTVRNQAMSLWFLFIGAFGTDFKYKHIVLVAFVCFFSLIILFSIAKWWRRTFTLNNQYILITEGVFHTKEYDVPIENVKSVNMSDSLIKRLFKITNLNIEVIGGEKHVFVLKQSEIRLVKQILGQEATPPPKGNEKVKWYELLLLATANKKILVTSMLAAAPLVLLLISGGVDLTLKFLHVDQELEKAEESGMFASAFHVDDNTTPSSLFELNAREFAELMFPFFLTCVLIIVGSYLLANLLVYLTYGRFKLIKTERYLDIHYGFFSKKNYHVPKNEIRSLIVSESLIMRKLGYVTIYIENVGYGDADKGDVSILLKPIIKKCHVNEFLTDTLPEFQLQNLEYCAEKKALPHFFVLPMLKPSLAFMLLLWVGGWHAKALLVILVTYFLYRLTIHFCEWKYEGFRLGSTMITLQNAKGYTIYTRIFKKEFVESTAVTQNYFMKRKSLMTYSFTVFSEALHEGYSCKFLTEKVKERHLHYLKETPSTTRNTLVIDKAIKHQCG